MSKGVHEYRCVCMHLCISNTYLAVGRHSCSVLGQQTPAVALRDTAPPPPQATLSPADCSINGIPE